MIMTLHIKDNRATLIKSPYDLDRAENLLNVPRAEFQLSPGEEVIQVRSRRTINKLLKERGIDTYSEFRYCSYKILG